MFLCNNATTSNFFDVEAAITSYLEKIVSFLVCLQENQEKRFPLLTYSPTYYSLTYSLTYLLTHLLSFTPAYLGVLQYL